MGKGVEVSLVRALPKSTASTANSAQPAIEPVICCLQVVHATTEARRPTLLLLLTFDNYFSMHVNFM